MRHQDKKKVLELLEAGGWTKHPSNTLGTRGVRVKGRAQVDVLHASDDRVDVFVSLSSVCVVPLSSLSRPVGRGWHARLVEALEEVAARADAPPLVSSDDVVEREPGDGPWPVLLSSTMNFVKHVRCEGARRHVLSLHLTHRGVTVTRCSEPYCIYNAPGPA